MDDLWGTQGGGLARMGANGTFYFVTDPGCPGLAIGDKVPEEWGLVPVNSGARELCNDADDFLDDDDVW